MTQKDFASEILRVTAAYWSLVLDGKRNMRIADARQAAGALGTPVDLWMDGKSEDRRAAWDAWRVGSVIDRDC